MTTLSILVNFLTLFMFMIAMWKHVDTRFDDLEKLIRLRRTFTNSYFGTMYDK